jgi:GT2 family glycosyltransferase
MIISVIICSLGRPAVLHDTVCSIVKQVLLPTDILLVSPSADNILPETLTLPGVRYIPSAIGATTQRNRGLDEMSAETELVVFFDDDVELCARYLEEMAKLFRENPEVLIACGTLLLDGGRGARVDRDVAVQACLQTDHQPLASRPEMYIPLRSAYGCNMAARASALRGIRFDESLPLYSWLEDADFAVRLTRGALGVVTCPRAKGVHLGWRGGRVSGVRFGFSQIVNPLYLWRKARIFPLPHVVIQFWLRCLVGNILGVLTGDKEYDRLGYLKGNLLGIKHLLSGKCDPTTILRM